MFKIPDNFYRVSIKALVLDNKKRFLLALEDNGLWELPGGGLNFGEKPHECLVRELKEEMGLEVINISEQPAYFTVALNINGQWKVNVLYEAKIKDLHFNPSSECRDLKFFTAKRAKKEKLYPIVKEFIKEFKPENHRGGVKYV